MTARLNATQQSNVNEQQRAPVADSYDRYYGSGLYDARYPRPNPATYRYVLRLATTAPRILDFGAGSGRYALPILQATKVEASLTSGPARDVTIPQHGR